MRACMRECPQWSVFSNAMLSKYMIYQIVVLGVLPCTVETWPVKQREIQALRTFHHCCLGTLLGISRQISQHINNEEIKSRIGLPETWQI